MAAGQVDAKAFRDAEQPATIMSHLEQFRRNKNMCDVVLEVRNACFLPWGFIISVLFFLERNIDAELV